VDLLLAAARREVHETVLEILHDGAELLNRLGTARQTGRLALDARLGTCELARSQAAVPGHRAHERRVLCLCADQGLSGGDHPFRERPARVKQLVRLIRREIAHGHRASSRAAYRAEAMIGGP